MDPQTLFLTNGQLESFVQKLADFRRTLSQPEQRVFDVILAAAEGSDADVEGYLLSEDAMIRRAAVGAVDRLSHSVGRLHPAPQGLFYRLAQARRAAQD